MGSFPRAVVLDLDGTIWSPEMYELWGGGGAPFTPVGHDAVVDRQGTKVKLLDGVWDCVKETKEHGALLCVASSTDEPDWARECLQKLGPTPQEVQDLLKRQTGRKWSTKDDSLAAHLDIVEIYKGSKQKHLKEISDAAGIEFREILFIDNEEGNIRKVSSLGVPSYYAPHGLTRRAWHEALKFFHNSSKEH